MVADLTLSPNHPVAKHCGNTIPEHTQLSYLIEVHFQILAVSSFTTLSWPIVLT